MPWTPVGGGNCFVKVTTESSLINNRQLATDMIEYVFVQIISKNLKLPLCSGEDLSRLFSPTSSHLGVETNMAPEYSSKVFWHLIKFDLVLFRNSFMKLNADVPEQTDLSSLAPSNAPWSSRCLKMFWSWEARKLTQLAQCFLMFSQVLSLQNARSVSFFFVVFA